MKKTTKKRKTTTKRKITKQRKKQITKKKCSIKNIYFEVILIIFLIPILTFTMILAFNTSKIYEKQYSKESKSVRILTDKNIYNPDDGIVLIVRNNSDELVYFEPCEYLDNFEKKVNGRWVAENKIIDDSLYDEYDFDKKNSVIKCKIYLPQSGEGIYRAVVNVYRNCEKPGYNMCRSSEIFYSNEFEVIGDKNDLCEDKILENCDGKKVSVIGTFITSKAHFLSEIEDRIVKYQWAGGILIHGHSGMEVGKKYNVIGVIGKGGRRCGDKAEQCMLDEKGMILPYPTRIEVEEVYLVK